MRWHLIVDPEGQSGAKNMSTDYALLQHAQQGGGFLRLYRWDPPCLSLGRNEPALTRYRCDQIRERGIDVVRRPTGGRAVWHEHELTYAVAAPVDIFGHLRAAYHEIHTMLAHALRTFGLPASLAPSQRTKAPTAGACFTSPVGGEVIVDGAKLIGSAQIREGTALLQHGSILIENGQDAVMNFSRGPTHAIHATSLTLLLGNAPTSAELITAITRQARKRWSGTWSSQKSSTYDMGSFNFDDDRWTWRR